ncbi:MAG: hypothetical protein V4662_11855 [Verrucomicrobiota bacterium]
MKLPQPTLQTISEDPQLMQRICLRIAIRRQLEADTLPAPERWTETQERPVLVPAVITILVLTAAWIFAAAAVHLSR